MTRLQQIFQQKQKNVLNIYCTAGFPQLNSTTNIIQTLEANQVDIIEIGMPYSDPLADGTTIQESSSVAIANGMTMEVLFQQLATLNRTPSPATNKANEAAIILMGYMNPVLQFGFEKFCQQAAAVGVDALILPDLPEYEFATEYGSIIKQYGLDFIFLVTPETTEARVKHLDNLSSGFLYAVSSSSTTGGNQNFNDVNQYIQRLQSYNLKNPILVGFGIHNKPTFQAACTFSNGAIIGSAFIKALANTNNVEATTKNFVESILN
jgi:tryptophan synthase alpha chain